MRKVQAINIKNHRNTLNKYYNVAKILLALTPFMGLMYLSMESSRVGLSMPEAIQQNPKLSIMFLVSMINPFIAYLLTFIQKKIDEGDTSYAVVNLVVFIICEALLQNLWYMILFGFILYKTSKSYNISVKDAFKEKLSDRFLMNISGSLVVLGLACICLFATIQINI
ncbi:MAG: hypothetical protein ACRCXA_12320 [Peptostreptococcaceae bacterium]